jgi:hypothetical protein
MDGASAVAFACATGFRRRGDDADEKRLWAGVYPSGGATSVITIRSVTSASKPGVSAALSAGRWAR